MTQTYLEIQVISNNLLPWHSLSSSFHTAAPKVVAILFRSSRNVASGNFIVRGRRSLKELGPNLMSDSVKFIAVICRATLGSRSRESTAADRVTIFKSICGTLTDVILGAS